MPPEPAPQVVKFGPYEANFVEGELRKHGTRLKIQAKPLSVLQLLISNQGKVVTHEELRKALWQDHVFVEFEKNLAIAVNKLRTVLSDSVEAPRYIETIPRRGYRFLASIENGNGKAPEVTATETISGNGASGTKVVENNAPPVAQKVAPPAWWPACIAHSRSLQLTAAAGATLTLFLLASALSVSRNRPKLKEKDTVVLANFANSTGEQVFDSTLRQRLSSQLEQSPSLNLLTDARISQTLTLMERPRDTFLSPNVAREVCARAGGAATVDGSVSKLGTEYVLDLEVINCKTGDVLGHEQSAANGKERVLAALDGAAKRLRRKLADSLYAVEKYEAPPEDVTTSSLDALEAYSAGYHTLLVENNSHPAILFFQRAISLDPQFAMAYARLAKCYESEDQEGLAAESFKRAYELRQHASEREKFYIDSYYEYIVKGNLETAARKFVLWAQTFPTDATPHAALGNIYSELGQHEQALSERKAALSLDPTVGLNYGNLAASYVGLHRFEEAQEIGQEAQARKLSSPEIHLVLAWAAWEEGKPAERDELLSRVRGDPQVEQWALEDDAAIARYAGQFAKSRALSSAAIDGYGRIDRLEAGPTHQVESAITEALVGNFQRSKFFAKAALAKDHSRDVRAGAAIALQLSGEAGEAARIIADLSSQYPKATVVQRNYLPSIRASIALRSGRPDEAVRALESAAPYEFGTLGYALLPIYLRGEAFLARRDGARAAAESAKLANFCPYFGKFPCALVRLQLARAYTLEGRSEEAKREYAAFLASWNHADPDIPILKRAKAEYAKLP